MYLTHLSLTDYRAFNRLDMDVPRRILLLVGDNAQGKTSILEAVYYLATFSSFHAQNDRQLLNFLSSQDSLVVGRIVAEFHSHQHDHRIEVRLILENGGNGGSRMRKEILVDGVKRPVHEALRHFNAVIFLPQMTRIVEGSPEERRRYLNMALSQAVEGYAQNLSDYAQVLTQRNALLKQLAERGGDSNQLLYWDELLARRGASIILARISAVSQIEKLASRVHRQLTHDNEILRILYQPAFDPLPCPEGQYSLPLLTSIDRSGFSEAQIYQSFLERLLQIRMDEINRGVTTIGPHRDDLHFVSNGVDLGDFGSRGQVRTLLLSLKLAEMAWLKEKNGEWPVLLLDEMMAELDIQHRADLLEQLNQSEQTLITTTDLKLFSPAFIENARVWQIHQGMVNTN